MKSTEHAHVGLPIPPQRGRIVIVNFEMGGRGMGLEMCKPGRPCVVIQNNKLERGRLITIVPLSTTDPPRIMPCHHKMDHRSFRDMPPNWGGQGAPRWAKCDYVATVSLDRCIDPYRRLAYDRRQYVRVRIIQSDLEAIERCVLWGLGINPTIHSTRFLSEQAFANSDPGRL